MFEQWLHSIEVSDAIARATGRTMHIIKQLEPGDSFIVAKHDHVKWAKNIIRDMRIEGISVYCLEQLLNNDIMHRSQGRIVLDHDAEKMYIVDEINHFANRIREVNARKNNKPKKIEPLFRGMSHWPSREKTKI